MTCPKCGSTNLFVEFGDLTCLPCGWAGFTRPPTPQERGESRRGRFTDGPTVGVNMRQIQRELNDETAEPLPRGYTRVAAGWAE